MSKVDIDQLHDMLYEYEEEPDDDLNMLYLKDTLHQLLEEISHKGIDEGRFYHSWNIMVKNGDALPRLYDTYRSKSMLSDEEFEVEVKEIQAVTLLENGNIMVEVLGVRREVSRETIQRSDDNE